MIHSATTSVGSNLTPRSHHSVSCGSLPSKRIAPTPKGDPRKRSVSFSKATTKLTSKHTPTNAGPKGGPPPKKKVAPVCCTVPISVLFVFACVLVACVFTAITVQSSLAFNKTVKAGVKDSVSPALENAMKYITDPLRQSAVFLKALREKIEASPQRFGCDDADTASFPGVASNGGFFYEAAMYGLQRPTLQYIYQTRLSTRYTNADGSRVPIACLVVPRMNQSDLFLNNTHLSGSYSSSADLETMRTTPTHPQPSYVDIRSLPFITDPLAVNGSMWLSSKLELQTIVGGSATTNTTPKKFSFLLQIYPNAAVDQQWAIGIDHNMNTLKKTLFQATPPIQLGAAADNSENPLATTPGAHTSLYNLNTNTLLSSTHPDMPLFDHNDELFTSGKSPVAAVNEAYEAALVKCAAFDCTTADVTMLGDRVHTAYRADFPESDLSLLMVQSVPRKFFFAEADRTFAITLGLSIGSCVFVVASCVALLCLIQRPLSSLKVNMIEAAELHNDRVVHTRTYLRDIAQLSAVFDGMNQQLTIARSFVPEAVLLGKTEDSQEDLDDEGSFTAGDKITVSTHHTASHRNSGAALADIDMTATTNNSSNNSSNGMSKLFNILEKRVGVLSLNLVGFHGLCAPDRASTRAAKINELSTALLTLAVTCAHGERGVMDSFHGDHFVLTFNASRAVSGPLAAAVRTAGAFIAGVYENERFAGCGGVGAGAAAGRSHVGTFGIDGYRRMSVVGEAYRTANGLQQAAVQLLRMNRGVDMREGCLVEEAALKELGNCGVHLQLVGCLQSSAHRALSSAANKPPLSAYFAHLVDNDTDEMDAMRADGEWLYELNAIEAMDPFVVTNRAMAALIAGDRTLCWEILSGGHDGQSVPKSNSDHGDDTVVIHVHAHPSADNVSPAWQFVRHQYQALARDVESGADAKQLTASAKHFQLPWVLFQQ